MRLKVAALALALSLPLAATAADPPEATKPVLDTTRPPVIVVLDTSRVLEGSRYAQMLQGRLKGLEDSIRSQLDPMQQTFDKARSAFESNRASMSPEQRESEGRKVGDLENQLQNARQQAQQAYAQQRDALAFQMRQTLEPVVDGLAKEKGWDLVITRPGGDLVWSAGRLDVSDLVIERLNALPMPDDMKPQAGQAQPAPSPAQQPAPKSAPKSAK